MLGLGNNLNGLRTKIHRLNKELAEIGEPSLPLDQVIDTTNTLRQNEYLTKIDAKRSELVSVYSDYTKQLEQIISSLFSIQSELKEIIKAEASLIDSEPKPKKTKKTTKKE